MSIGYDGPIPARPKLVTGKGKTKQSFKDKVDINKIIKRHHKTGMIEHINKKEPFYGDVSDIAGYQESLEVVMKANELFGNMSAEIRKKFKNNPMDMITWLQDPKNAQEAFDLGMTVKKPEYNVNNPDNDPLRNQNDPAKNPDIKPEATKEKD